jgi:hypothetical protein
MVHLVNDFFNLGLHDLHRVIHGKKRCDSVLTQCDFVVIFFLLKHFFYSFQLVKLIF